MSRNPLERLARPAKQTRSRQTVDRLLDAAEEVLASEGLEAATVPEIAGRAGLSVGVVYRRFPDKDALMRGVYERYLSRAAEKVRRSLDPRQRAAMPAEKLIAALVHGLVRSYREQAGLLRALTLYAQSHPDPRVRRKADALNRASIEAVRDVLLVHRRHFSHPDPETAIEFGLTVIANMARTVILASYKMRYPRLLPDDRMIEELTRMYLAYLGVE